MGSETRYLVTDRFYVDRRSEALVVDGAPVPMNHRTYQVMLLLMARPKALVSKRELFENIWGTLEVSDAVLTTAIKELRQALGDDARAPWAIATVHARGYRFLLPVHESDTPELPTDDPIESPGVRRSSRLAWIAAATAVFILGFSLLMVLHFPGGQPTQSGQLSIAVLPFDDLSEAGDQKWFADGLAEEILNSLAQSKDLLVAARTSSFRYGGGGSGGIDIREVGKALNVTHVMEGSVRRSSDQLRVTAQLIRSEDGFHVWSKTYDVPADTHDALSLQRNIAEDVLVKLKADTAGSTTPDEHSNIPMDTYARFLRGRELVVSRRPDAVLEGLTELNMLVQLAPDFAPGHAWLSYAYIFSTQFSGRPVVESGAAARLHVNRALELDPDGADTLTAAALLELIHRNIDLALDYANRAVAANPNNVAALRRRGVIYINLGRVEDAHKDFQAVVARDPLAAVSLAHLADTSWLLNDREGALKAARDGVRWNSDDAISNGTLGRILADVGEYIDAIRYLERAVELNPNAALSTLALAGVYWQVGLDDRMDFAEPGMAWNGMAAAAMSAGNFERGLELAEVYGMGSTGSFVGMHIYHWYGDAGKAYAPAIRQAERDALADAGLDHSYRLAAIPVMLALEANRDSQADDIRRNLSTLFAGKEPGYFEFGGDIYGAASWQMVNDNPEEALAWLHHAQDQGIVFRALHLDPIWNPIRQMADFQSILAATDARAESLRKAYRAGN